MDIPSVKDMLDFTGKVVLVTGAGSGVGRGIALRFAEAGATVVVHYRSSAAGAQSVVQRIVDRGRQAIAHQADVTEEAEVARLIKRTVEAFGRLDVLVNNAGIYPLASLLEMTPMQWDQMIAANLRSVFLCTQAAATQMIEQGGGAIVTGASLTVDGGVMTHQVF